MVSCDFETNYDQTDNVADVWSACMLVHGGQPEIYRTIDVYIRKLYALGKANVYFHNLKFDGEFILYYLHHNKNFKHAYIENEKRFKTDKEMKPRDYKYLISDKGVWYIITIRTRVGFIRIYDSFKRSPISLAKCGEAFNTKHRKLEMQHEKWHDSDTVLTQQEKDYIKNDVWVMDEFLTEFENQGHTKMTIGSCALEEFKKMYGKQDFKQDFPDVFADSPEGDFVLKAYHGAFVYVNPYKKGKIIKNGWTLDVNSLYAYVQHSMSGNIYPYGYGTYWIGKKPKKLCNNETIDFIHFKCKFRVREGYLPFVHIKNDPRYPASKILETSDLWIDGEWIEKGEDFDTTIEFTMQGKEFKTFLKHYHVKDFKIIDGYTYYARSGIFDDYINHFMQIKATSTGGKRYIAKQFLVNLYGKFATKQDSSFKVIDDAKTDDKLVYKNIEEYNKKPGYIPIGACITSNAMLYTLEHAQKCYHKDKPGFCYSDTDSIHGDGHIPDFDIDKTKLGCWDLEKQWDIGYFLRVKSYLEIVGDTMDITCAGMPKHCKNLFAKSCGYKSSEQPKSIDDIRFLLKKRTILDFKPGLRVPGKLHPTRVIGGIALLDTTFTIKREKEYGQLYGRNTIL